MIPEENCHTEEEAQKLWCPMARYAREGTTAFNRCEGAHDYLSNPKSCRCIASDCAMWRWARYSEDKGYCGLGGRAF